MENARQKQVEAAFGHIVDATSRLTRDDAMLVATALRAGWLTGEERIALSDLAAGFDRLSTAGAE